MLREVQQFHFSPVCRAGQAVELWQLLGDGCRSEVAMIGVKGRSCDCLDLAFRYFFGKAETSLARVEMGVEEADNQIYPLMPDLALGRVSPAVR